MNRKILWRWKGERTSFCEDFVVAETPILIKLHPNDLKDFGKWFRKEELEFWKCPDEKNVADVFYPKHEEILKS